MWIGKFDLQEGLVRIDGLLHGPLGALGVRCIIDTGCPLTLIDTAIVDKLGYGAKMGKRVVRLWGIETSQEGYHLEVSRLEIMGLDLRPVGIVCHDSCPSSASRA